MRSATRKLKPLLIVGIVTLIGVFLTSCGYDKYDVYIGKEAVSPNSKMVATFYTISGGGAAGYVITRLNIRPSSEKFEENNDFVFELRHGMDIELKWQGNNHLLVTYEEGSDTYRQWNTKNKVKITYVTKKLPTQ